MRIKVTEHYEIDREDGEDAWTDELEVEILIDISVEHYGADADGNRGEDRLFIDLHDAYVLMKGQRRHPDEFFSSEEERKDFWKWVEEKAHEERIIKSKRNVFHVMFIAVVTLLLMPLTAFAGGPFQVFDMKVKLSRILCV